jgi:hypothetical protein
MNQAQRWVLGLVTVVMLAPACGVATTSTTPTTSPVPGVAIPKGFPSDFPVYPGARLTVANQSTANGHPTWGMEWETLDNLAAVQGFYISKLKQGDWTLQLSSSGNGTYSAILTRKSNSKDAGLLTVEVESTVTHIRLELGTSS